MMHRFTIAAAVLAGLLIVGATKSFATVLVDQHPVSRPNDNGLRSTTPGEIDQQIADNFELATNSLIAEVSWSGRYYYDSVNVIPPSYPTEFTVRFFAGSPPSPTPFFSEVVVPTFVQTGTTQFNPFLPLYRFTAPLESPPILPGDTNIWLSVIESDPDTNVDFVWSGSQDSFGGIIASRVGEGSTWSNGTPHWGTDMAFTLSGIEVPEPTGLVVIAMGMSMFPLVGRSRKIPERQLAALAGRSCR